MKEKLSAMLDGNVDAATARALFTRLKHDAAFRDDWETYCLVGDVIRGGAQPEMDSLSGRVMLALEREPTVLAPHRSGHDELADDAELGRAAARRPRAVHHRLLPVAASVMGVLLAVGALAVLSGGDDDSVASVQMAAKSPQIASVSSAMRRVVSGARPDYLVAHQTMAGGPMPAAMQYMRSVSGPTEE
ncbi:MAG: sigma-E factor negative regulatory protein [Azoarcus sp.]|jgi:sigma-E factor negative regulatory protein RseA|nr:sigma-E factor negative regulatory protein [Azoarcus sp.]